MNFWLSETKNNLEFMVSKINDFDFNGDFTKINNLVEEVLELIKVFVLITNLISNYFYGFILFFTNKHRNMLEKS